MVLPFSPKSNPFMPSFKYSIKNINITLFDLNTKEGTLLFSNVVVLNLTPTLVNCLIYVKKVQSFILDRCIHSFKM